MYNHCTIIVEYLDCSWDTLLESTAPCGLRSRIRDRSFELAPWGLYSTDRAVSIEWRAGVLNLARDCTGHLLQYTRTWSRNQESLKFNVDILNFNVFCRLDFLCYLCVNLHLIGANDLAGHRVRTKTLASGPGVINNRKRWEDDQNGDTSSRNEHNVKH